MAGSSSVYRKASIVQEEVTTIRIPRELQIVLESVQEKKAEDVVILDMRKLTSFTDFFLICTGESEPQIKAISKNVQEKLAELGWKPGHLEGRSDTGWVLLDYSDFVVHIFSPEKRGYYELERLWADAPRMTATHQKVRAAG
jgi:ribosome-associated protein